jgi:hypothetical protein
LNSTLLAGTGHRDTDNLIRDNDVVQSGKVGVLFRPERGRAFARRRNWLENNRIVDSGFDVRIGIDAQGNTEAIILARNQLRSRNGKPDQQMPEYPDVTGNQIG